jgi:PPOX class probable F420-dependent enzyme
MSELSMTTTEREEFLAGPHIGVLAVARGDGPPLVTPVWYRYSPGGRLEFTTERSSEKVPLLESSGRATLCAQREELPYAYVTVEGPVEITEATREIRVEIAVRYLGEDMGMSYVNSTAVADNVLVRLSPQRWRTTDYAKFTIPGS